MDCDNGLGSGRISEVRKRVDYYSLRGLPQKHGLVGLLLNTRGLGIKLIIP